MRGDGIGKQRQHDRLPSLQPSAAVAGVEQALSIKFNNLVYEMKAAGRDVITLSLGEAFFDIPMPAFDGIADQGIHHYSHSRGLPQLREILAKYYQVRFGQLADPDHEVIITAGSKAAIFMALLATLEPGDEAIIPEPFWLSYPAQVQLCGGRPVMVPQDVTVFDLERYVTSCSKVIIINNPNNPTGRIYSRAELEYLHGLASRQGLFLLVDEAYNEFVPEPDQFIAAGSLDPEKTHTIIVNSMSKNHGISGWRIGYLLAHRLVIDQILKINQHLITCAPTPLSCYLEANFDRLLDITRPQIRRTVQVRNRMADRLTELGIRSLPGNATFYLFASLGDSTLSSTEFTIRLLRESAVSVVPGIGYGESCDRFIRISVGTETEERIERGLIAIRDLIESTSPNGRSSDRASA